METKHKENESLHSMTLFQSILKLKMLEKMWDKKNWW
jgi:hypothetical protein